MRVRQLAACTTLAALGLTACSSAPAPTPRPTPTPTKVPALVACRADVGYAKYGNELTALDPAIHDCSSVAMLEKMVDANPPGWFDMTESVKTFATHRCEDPTFVDVKHALVCQELELP